MPCLIFIADENTYPSGCIYGMPMLVMTQGLSRLEYDLEECFTGKDCHEGFICTDGYIQDVVGRCCHAKPCTLSDLHIRRYLHYIVKILHVIASYRVHSVGF